MKTRFSFARFAGVFLCGAKFLPHARTMGSVPNPAAAAPGQTPTIEEQLTSARADLTSAQSQITTLTSERDQARTDLTAAQGQVTSLQSQFDVLQTTANDLRAQLTAAQSQVTTLTSERDQAQGSLKTANENVSRLEALCGVKGIDPKSAVPSGPSTPENSGKSASDFEERYKSAKSDKEREEVLSEYSKTLNKKAGK